MTDTLGTAWILAQEPTLEDRIKQCLANVPSDATLEDTYADAADRRRARRRALITATLDAIFEHQFPAVSDKGIEVEVGTKPDVLSELAAARRDFMHDAKRLDSGAAAELALKPTKTDDNLTTKTLTAQKKEAIVWLVLAHIWHDEVGDEFPTQTSVFDAAGKATDRSSGSFRTELSHFTTQKGPSTEELAHFWDLAGLAEQLAKTAGNAKGRFSLLLPAAKVLSGAAIRKPKKRRQAS